MKRNMFTKRHYEVIAKTLHDIKPVKTHADKDVEYYLRLGQYSLLLQQFVYAFEKDNTSFNNNEFLKAVKGE